MTEQQFCYWLQGFVELNAGFRPTPDQWQSICEHLALCFKKVTPPVARPELGKEFADALDRLRKEGAKYQQAQPWPPLGPNTGVPPHWLQDGGKTTLIC